MNNIVKNVIIFSAGLGVGAVAAIQFVKKKYEQIAEEEIASVLEYTKRKKTEGDSKTKDVENDEQPMPRKRDPKVVEMTEKGNYKKIARKYSNYDEDVKAADEQEKQEADEEYREFERMSEEANSGDYKDPYVIDMTAFSEEKNHYDKVNLYYYVGDDTLCDVDEDQIDDRRRYIGEDALDNFDDHNTVYVRNERLAIDYEIILVNGRYSELVLGMHDED